MKQLSYKPYITGLKGFACVMVMLGHFLGLFVYAENMPIDINSFLTIRNSKIGFILNESYWLYLFFIVSGYLLAFSKIEKIQQLLIKCIQRFLRLGLPVLFAYCIIFIIYKTIGFHNGDTNILFENTWYQSAYSGDFTVLTVIKSPIDVLLLGKCSLNSPYWVLKDMFFASILIYLTVYLKSKAESHKVSGWMITLIFFAISCIITSKTCIFCFLGAILSWCENDFKILKEKQMFYLFVLLIALCLSVVGKIFIQAIFFIALILFVPKLKFLNLFFLSKASEFIGKISFGIYSFHWSIYCSVGALIILYMSPQIGLLYSVIVAILSSFVFTLILSWLYNIIFEKLSGVITGKVYTFLCKCIISSHS